MIFVRCLICLFALPLVSAWAGDPASSTANLPYLGPGVDKLSAADYERIYKNYIQTSVLLGYSFLQERPAACDQALGALFRQAGLYTYPVPAEAEQVRRFTKTNKALRLETYSLGGNLLQLARASTDGALRRVLMVNSASPKAIRRIEQIAKAEFLELNRDPVTGLERLHGLPVGFPHPLLTNDGQGLYVKELRFNGQLEGCEPVDFQDNAWVGGFDLSEARCTALQTDAAKVWSEQLSPADFSDRELERMKEIALKNALAKGESAARAKALVDKHFTPPLTNTINVVGSAMRNLAQCNLLAMGRVGKPKAASGSSPQSETPAGAGTPASGTAK